jgi:hypothetical protein
MTAQDWSITAPPLPLMLLINTISTEPYLTILFLKVRSFHLLIIREIACETYVVLMKLPKLLSRQRNDQQHNDNHHKILNPTYSSMPLEITIKASVSWLLILFPVGSYFIRPSYWRFDEWRKGRILGIIIHQIDALLAYKKKKKQKKVWAIEK